jgi:hypothetical protein
VAFHGEGLDLTLRPGAPAQGWKGLPEVAIADRLRAAGADAVKVRLFLTFTAAMDRARDADRLWNSACKLFFDHSWVFRPEEISSRPLSELADLLRSYRVSQRHGPDTAGWRTIGESLANPTRARLVRAAVFEGQGDTQELLSTLQTTNGNGDACFPFLRGPKVGPMWVRMLAVPGGAQIAGLETLPVAVDVQVRKVTEYLGVTKTHGQDLERVRRHIQAVWAADVKRHGAEGPAAVANTPAALDPALWFFAKWGCTFCERAGRKIPVSDICKECQFDTFLKS